MFAYLARMFRGSSWSDLAQHAPMAYRNVYDPSLRVDYLSLRLLRRAS